MIRPLLLAISYILLSFASFPGINAGWVVWVSFVPLFLLLERYSSPKSYILAFLLVEWIKWILLVVWLRHVSWVAVLGVAFGFSCFHLFWFLALRVVLGSHVWSGLKRASVLTIVGLACLWSAMEWLRTQPYGLTGAHLSITQWQTPVVLQVSAWIGGYGLGGIIVGVNLLIAQFLARLRGSPRKSIFYQLTPLMTALAVIVGLYSLGISRLIEFNERKDEAAPAVRIAVIQPYCPAYRSWNYERMTKVIEKTLSLSRDTAKQERIDLMVWPEGTLPGSVYPGSAMEREVLDLVNHYLRVPLVFGNQSQSDGSIYNSILVCVPNSGILEERYH